MYVSANDVEFVKVFRGSSLFRNVIEARFRNTAHLCECQSFFHGNL